MGDSFLVLALRATHWNVRIEPDPKPLRWMRQTRCGWREMSKREVRAYRWAMHHKYYALPIESLLVAGQVRYPKFIGRRSIRKQIKERWI